MNNKIIKYAGIIFLFVFIINIVFVKALVADPVLDVRDNYDFGASSREDNVAFENYGFGFQIYNLTSSDDPDLLCYNFDVFGNTNSYGGEDYCIYTSSTSRDQCISCLSITVPLSKMSQTSSLEAILLGNVCDGCEYDTSTRFGDSIQGNVYYNCDQCASSSVSAIGEGYQVIRPRQYFCSVNEDRNFITRGRFPDRISGGLLKWTNYKKFSCSDLFGVSRDYGCATDRDEIDDNTGQELIPFPCAIKEGIYEENQCSINNDCISRNCGGGGQTTSSQCTSDGSQTYQVNSDLYRDACGGTGWLDVLMATSGNCSEDLNNNYVCDSGLSGTSPADFCRIKEYSSCSLDSDCWNDNGGYDCLGLSGNKICTTGANGKQCFNNDNAQCDSYRCDSTCQAKLASGQSCDENSDCTNGLCSGGTCGGTGVVVDLAVVEIKPIQVIYDVDLVKGKQGIIRVIVTNYGSNLSQGLVNVSFDGVQLSIASGDTAIKDIPANRNETFDFTFTPNSVGTKQIVANVTAV